MKDPYSVPVRCRTKAGKPTTRRFHGRTLGSLGELILPNESRHGQPVRADVRVLP